MFPYFRLKRSSPTRMPCPPPATCWTCCCRKTPAQALARPPPAQGPRAPGPRARAPDPTAASPLAPPAPVSRFYVFFCLLPVPTHTSDLRFKFADIKQRKRSHCFTPTPPSSWMMDVRTVSVTSVFRVQNMSIFCKSPLYLQ